jgi:hypothetical protein
MLDSSMQRYRAAMDSDAPFEERIREVVLLARQCVDMSDEFLKDVLGLSQFELSWRIIPRGTHQDLLGRPAQSPTERLIRKIKPAFILFMLEDECAHVRCCPVAYKNCTMRSWN